MKKFLCVYVLLSVFSLPSAFALDYVRETVFVSEGFAGEYNVAGENESIILAGSAEVADVINGLVEVAKTKNDKYAIFLCDIKAHKVSYLASRVRFSLYRFTQVFDIKNCRLRD